MPYDFTLSSGTLANGRTAYYGQLTGTPDPRFVIGYRTQYLGQFGLFNTSTTPGLVYDAATFEQAFGFWAWFILPTAMAESKGSFYCLNTYDRARFTFSFMQYAAHVPNGDFVVFLRRLLALPLAAEYFPRLVLQNNRIGYRNNNGPVSLLENDNSTEALMNYLNPSGSEIERQELICAARLVHWASHDELHRQLQVETAVAHFRKNMLAYHQRFNLHGAPAKVCLMVADIRHQGRATNDRIALALNTGGNYAKAYQHLCTIGETHYAERIKTLKTSIAKLTANGKFNYKYDANSQAFVPE